MRGLYDLIVSMPLKNCGHCGWPSCSTLARRMTTGDAKVADCIYLSMPEYVENKSKIESLLKEGIKIGVKTPTSSEKVTYIRPCTTESGKVTATTRFILPYAENEELKYGFFDSSILCGLLKNFPSFEDIKCSEKMSIARITYYGKSVLLFGNGQIKVRKAKNKKDVHATIELLSRIMWGSIICPDCGCYAIDCASGGCNKCLVTLCPILIAPPVLNGDKIPQQEKVNVSKIFKRLDVIETKDGFMEGIKTMNEAVKDFKKMMDGEGRIDIVKFNDKMIQISLDFIVKTVRLEDAVLGILLMGITRDLTRVIEAASSIKFDKNELAKEAGDMVIDAYYAFRNSDPEKGKDIEYRYGGLSKKIAELNEKEGSKSQMLETEKLVRNGEYIVKLLKLPI